MKEIKILIVDDSAIARQIIEKGISSDKAIKVTGKVSGVKSAVEYIFLKEPDVILLDINLPGMNGLDFLGKIMSQDPRPVIMITSYSKRSSEYAMKAFRIGAVDFIIKPSSFQESNLNVFIDELLIKIKKAALTDKTKLNNTDRHQIYLKKIREKRSLLSNSRASSGIIAIGASAGGVEVLYRIIPQLKKDNLPGILIVQHMPEVFTYLFAERLNKLSELSVKEAQDGDIITNDSVFIAPGKYHMEIKKYNENYRIICRKGESVNGHCPAVDVLFKSVSEIAPENCMAFLLTGMGGDGAKGLSMIKKKGGMTFAQNKESSMIYGMPFEAVKLNAVSKQLSIEEIISTIQDCADE